jgi:hypothetical protein
MDSKRCQVGYHEEKVKFEIDLIEAVVPYYPKKYTYYFDNFFHPYVSELIARINQRPLSTLFDPKWQKNTLNEQFFDANYDPVDTTNTLEVVSYPKNIDILPHGPYAVYNWELFYHIPLTIAVHLSKNRRFAEAQRWFHFIFDPTSAAQNEETAGDRYWRFIAFQDTQDPKQIDYLLALISKDPSELDADDKKRREDILDSYQQVVNRPFQPHAVARTRHLAYQYNVVMKYLDNLIAWGDHLFQQDTVESINEATLQYILAANILGPRPQQIPVPGKSSPRTFADIKDRIDRMGNALTELEGQFPLNLAPAGPIPTDSDQGQALFGMGRTLYFCIPRNEKLLGYWDTVGDRLFKIRHCMNIQGIVRPLALFDPPLDPGMLVKAAAAGIDIDSIVSGHNQPPIPIRSLYLIQKALELSSDVRNLGYALLSALEKADAEHLSLIRQRHEVEIQKKSKDVRFLQWKAAEEATSSLLASRGPMVERLKFYGRLLGHPADPNAPDTITLERKELTEENFDEAYAGLVDAYDKQLTLLQLPNLTIAGDSDPSLQAGSSGSGRLYLNQNEDAELNKFLPTARDARLTASGQNTIAGVLTLIPDFNIDTMMWGIGGDSKVSGGDKLSDTLKIAAEISQARAGWAQDQAGIASRTAGYERRADEWMLQYNLAARELMQNGRQILASLIAEQIAHKEYENIEQQIRNSEEIDQFLQGKFTNEDLHLWMKGEISRLYYEYYRFAFETARRAEQAMKKDLMRPELDSQDFVKFNYWDSGHKGLLSGEALYLDIKRMEMAYHENNKRELELVRHVSLRQLDPVALLILKTTGKCQVTIPEWLYDLDCPGHYMRRIKNVALSIPSVVGPYTSVNCTLSLLSSRVRKSPSLKDGEYTRQEDDDRFIEYTGAVQSIVTSTASHDSGMFEANMKDDRYLWFEGAGAESTWQLMLPSPADYPAFDYQSISDVILHIAYTARQGVDPTKVMATLDELFKDASKSVLALVLNLRRDFTDEWYAFATGTGDFSGTITRDFFPYFTQGKSLTLTAMEVYSRNAVKHHSVPLNAIAGELTRKAPATITLSEDPQGPMQVIKRNANEDVYLILRYTL